MYKDIESMVINNGNSWELERGVRQGCPLSDSLSITLLKTLANKIRNTKKHKRNKNWQ